MLVIFPALCVIAFVVVPSLSCLTLWDPVDCSTPGSLSFINSQHLLKFMSIESMMLSNHLILCHPLLLLPSIFPSISDFSSQSALRIRWPKYWSFSISSSSEYSELISFRIDWFDPIHSSVYMSIPISQFIPPPPLTPISGASTVHHPISGNTQVSVPNPHLHPAAPEALQSQLV